ncbi:glucose-6-phosphate isomerase [Plantactinospora siamensis]|uniref:Glucose-6-phosphate isomerase n=1 Tax=Plantactinospora siamensis TaxID=555372 RepID=A0ABV6NZ62_9ACTN
MTDLLSGPVEAGGGVSVYGAEAVDRSAPASARSALVAAGVPGRMSARDAGPGGAGSVGGARTGLGWLDTHRRSRELLPQLAELCDELGDLEHVVVVGTGAAALASAAIARTTGRPLTVLDGVDPVRVRAALGDRLERTVVVLADGAGSSPATDALRRVYRQAFLDTGRTAAEAGRHFVVVTEPDSPLVETAAELGAFVVLAEPAGGGRFAALDASALVPAALAGVEVVELLDQAEELAGALGGERDNPGLALGAALGAAATNGRDRVALLPDGSGLDGLGDWIAQLLAGATGRDGVGILPVVMEAPGSPGSTGPDVLSVSYGGALRAGAVPGGGASPDLAVVGPLGAQFLTWQYAAAVAAEVLGVDPFDRSGVAAAEREAERLLAQRGPTGTPTFVEGSIEVYGPTAGPRDLAGSLAALLAGIGAGGYLAVQAYLDPSADADAARLRPLLAAATGRTVTFDWAARALAGAGQYHRGGPPLGSFLHLTGAADNDLPVPDRPYTLGELQAAQAAGDRAALRRRDRPLLRLHLTDRAAGLSQLLHAVRNLRS